MGFKITDPKIGNFSTTPPPAVYDYKTDPTFLNWKAQYDEANAVKALGLESAWNQKYAALNSLYGAANADLETFKPYKGMYETANKDLETFKPYKEKYETANTDLQNKSTQLQATQVNFDDLNNRYSDLQKNSVKTTNPSLNGSTGGVNTPVNMQNYNDARAVSNDQWWSKFLSTGRR